MNKFEKYLSLWVSLCIILGVIIGKFLPIVPNTLELFEYANVSIPIAVLIWLMIFPMMLKVDFTSIKSHIMEPKGLILTLITNWLIKPFTMFGIATLFFLFIWKLFIPLDIAKEYIAGAVLLGAAPCTAMVFVWSKLTKGSPSYTVLQVAVNDLIILVAFAPIVMFLLGIGGISIPYDTLILSIVLYVVIPLTMGVVVRRTVIKNRGGNYFINFVKKFDKTTISGLLLTLVLIFSFQGDVILEKPLYIVLIAIPLIFQTVIIFLIAYIWANKWGLKHEIAAPAAMIGASNFFELAVAVAISLFGLNSGATLVTVVGVLVEVPIMLSLVKVANRTKSNFK